MMGAKSLVVASLEHTTEHSIGVTEMLTKSVAIEESEERPATTESSSVVSLELKLTFSEDSGSTSDSMAWIK